MSWKYRGDSTLENARRELGVNLADDPLAQHLALQIEATELALEHRVDWLVEKRDEELERARQESTETLAASYKPSGKPKPGCPACGAVSGSPHLPSCPHMAALIRK